MTQQEKIILETDNLLNEVFEKDKLRWGDKDGWCVLINPVAQHVLRVKDSHQQSIRTLVEWLQSQVANQNSLARASEKSDDKDWHHAKQEAYQHVINNIPNLFDFEKQ